PGSASTFLLHSPVLGMVTTSCVSSSAVKPGYCPEPTASKLETCTVSCQNDSHCAGRGKCCGKGCLALCMAAEPGEAGPGTGDPHPCCAQVG
uniref:WAP domain-containing protein n=1 Tax=Pelusios castaneus TaxID=367368 RepID=A0A8C8VKU6_9SAUR